MAEVLLGCFFLAYADVIAAVHCDDVVKVEGIAPFGSRLHDENLVAVLLPVGGYPPIPVGIVRTYRARFLGRLFGNTAELDLRSIIQLAGIAPGAFNLRQIYTLLHIEEHLTSAGLDYTRNPSDGGVSPRQMYYIL